MWKKIKYLLLFFVIGISITGFFIAKNVLPYAILQPPRVSENTSPLSLDLSYEDISITVEDSVQIKGYWIKNNFTPAKSLIIFIHGIGGCKEHFLGLAKHLSELGVESILLDSRAHGKSGGNFCTYGFKEKYDITKVIDYLKQKEDSIPIGIWGNSMGGAIAIQALEADKRINFGIIESTFTSLEQIVYDYQKSYAYGIGLRPLCNLVLSEAGKLAQFTPELVSPISSVKNIEQPIIIAHGEADEKIKFEYGKMLFENLKSTQKRFLPVKGGTHTNLSKKGGKEYSNVIKNFILEQSR